MGDKKNANIEVYHYYFNNDAVTGTVGGARAWELPLLQLRETDLSPIIDKFGVNAHSQFVDPNLQPAWLEIAKLIGIPKP